MQVTLRKMPGDRNPTEWRFMFREAAGQRGVDHVVVGDAESLRAFLADRLEVAPGLVSSTVAQSEAYGSAHFELDFTSQELRELMKALGREAKAAATPVAQ